MVSLPLLRVIPRASTGVLSSWANLAAILLACQSFSQDYAAELVLPITEDAYIDSRAANQSLNYGQASTVRVLVNDNSVNDGSVCRGLFKLPSPLELFDAGQLAKVQVRFYIWQDNTGTRNITLYPLAASFSEGSGYGELTANGATWLTRDGSNVWTNAGGDFDASFPVVGLKEDILDPDMQDRFLSWDITALFTNSPIRAELFRHGAMLKIDETPIPTSGMPRAPFTSADDASYGDEYKPVVRVTIRPQTTDVQVIAMDGSNVHLLVRGCAPIVTNTIERSGDLSINQWTTVAFFATGGVSSNWAAVKTLCGTNMAFFRVTTQ